MVNEGEEIVNYAHELQDLVNKHFDRITTASKEMGAEVDALHDKYCTTPETKEEECRSDIRNTYQELLSTALETNKKISIMTVFAGFNDRLD